MSIAGCGQAPPAGQVIATVAGDDITRREIAAELQATGAPADASAALRDAALHALVERRLLVAAARERGLDRTPEYLATVRRTRDLILTELLARQLEAAVPDPSDVRVAAYVRTHPWMFAERMAVLVDPASGGVRSWLDSAAMSGADAMRLKAAAVGEVVAIGPPEDRTRVAIVARRAVPINGAPAAAGARAALRREAATAALDALLAQARLRRPIRYQQGYGPAAR